LVDGYKTSVALLDDDYSGRPEGWSFRPFTISVVATRERIRVPAGEFTTFRVAIAPMDGNPKMTSTIHIQASAPRFVVRKEFIVNPKTFGKVVKRSTGTEELISIEWI